MREIRLSKACQPGMPSLKKELHELLHESCGHSDWQEHLSEKTLYQCLPLFLPAPLHLPLMERLVPSMVSTGIPGTAPTDAVRQMTVLTHKTKSERGRRIDRPCISFVLKMMGLHQIRF